jgi:TrmH family RNA methyltransferase
MIPHRKLRSLPRTTRLRKIVRILQAAEIALHRNEAIDAPYLGVCAALVEEEAGLDASTRQSAGAVVAWAGAKGTHGRDNPPAEWSAEEFLRAVNRLRHCLLKALGEEPAEWDLLAPDSRRLDASRRTVHAVEVYLEEIRSPFNLGSIFRSAEAFGVRRILLSPGTASPLHPRAQKTARGAETVVLWRYVPLSWLRQRGDVVALELGGTPLCDFRFPESGVLLVGSEELGLSAEALAMAGAGRVSIPMAGVKRSLNVAVAFGIVMQAWNEQLSSGSGL